MSTSVARVIRVIKEDEGRPRAADYWRNRSFTERLEAVLALHREGNELFRGGDVPFRFELRVRHVQHSE